MTKKIIIGITVTIIVSFIIREAENIFGQNVYNVHVQDERKSVKFIQAQTGSKSSNNSFLHQEPYFTLILPNGLSLKKAIDNNGIVAYTGETETIVCRLQIIDTYTLSNSNTKNNARKLFDYNLYSQKTMDAAYDSLVKSTVASSPYANIINVEHSLEKIDNKIFVYIKYEIKTDDGNMIRKSYNFFVNGYSIAVYGIYLKSDKNAEMKVDAFLKSIKFK